MLTFLKGAIKLRLAEKLNDKSGEFDEDKWKICWKQCRDKQNQFARDKKKAVKRLSKQVQIATTAANVETAIQNGDKDNALSCFDELKVLLKLK